MYLYQALIYMAFIPSLSMIGFLLFSKKASKKYNVKQAINHLVLELVLMTGMVIPMNSMLNSYLKLRNLDVSTYIILFAWICVAYLAPVFIPMRYKNKSATNANEEKTNKKNSWIYILFGIGASIIAVLSIFWLMFFAT